MDIGVLAKKLSPEIIEMRRWYHAHPELSGHEKNTREKIREDLISMGITDITCCKNCYGLTATLHGARAGKTVALRADTDALPIHEETGLPFASENDGVMHACGHDAHIAMALGAAKILAGLKDELDGDVKFLFQPSEENGKGAKAMIAEGVLDGVDALYGAHIWGTVDAPLIIAEEGPRMAACHRFKVTVTGTSAHGSEPHLGVDAISAASIIVASLQQCVSRMNSPLNPMVLTVGTIRGGEDWNVIPKKVTMNGCVRTFQQGDAIERQMRRVIEQTAESFGAKGELEYNYIAIPLINSDRHLVGIARDAVKELYGREYLGQMPPLMSSEDFPWYTNKIPGVFVYIGSRNEKKGITATNHQETYTVDEDVLPHGAAVMAAFAQKFLNNPK